ncbi:phosphate ABC transporter ATP-binding protein [Candidatus Gottesmanbacteria bacterium RIFCSPHIGHO2_01_FULL_39_10]|uniref:Phosphate ABC transporter ATP-binding protein n=1 Tax=Candidatus Gottesmanbacteria bacterium RIFCSPHIGHO2_01_FULL_39_10 TaxID=1798375 RepID=A0A1F5ZQ56_9BACT|nr:MAG: phosphate ABC transporter ATP-binding protein [Candidatus Gottesmanbacteria bacterium RIFCSPHIGHO2_01_FULL_39_10]
MLKDKIQIENLDVYFGEKHVLTKVNMTVHEHEILSIIGPANGGKSTILRVLNRMLDNDKEAKVRGKVCIDGKNIYDERGNVNRLRKSVGIIFAIPVPLPMSIFDNLSYGPRLHGITNREKLLTIAEKCLRAASLWDEVKSRLSMSALRLSGGQQQRLCLARALTVEPEIILFDEPCSGLDPISTSKVEKTMLDLQKQYTIVLVTNNVKQAERVSDRCAFFLFGELVEIGSTKQLFKSPKDKRTKDYITGKFG